MVRGTLSDQPQEKVTIRPGVGMLGLLASMNYKPWYALSEFVDNAVASWVTNRNALLAAGERRLRVSIDFDAGAGTIMITDNAAGIAAIDVDRAFKSAEPPPDASGLSQFGIGMKAAACWYAQRFTVESSALGEAVRRTVTFDIPAIVQANRDELPVAVRAASADAHGTKIMLSHLHRNIPTGRTLGKVRDYLASIYREYLTDEFELLVKGRTVAFVQPAILNAPRWNAPAGEAVEWKKDVAVKLPDGRVVAGWAALRAKGSTKEAGLALLYRRKVVVGAGAAAAGDQDLYRPPAVFGSVNNFVSQRLFGELDVSALRVTSSKDAIIWDGHEEDFLAELRKQLDSEPVPLLKMGAGHRVNERGAEVGRRVEDAVASTAAAAAATELPEDPGTEEDELSPRPAEPDPDEAQVNHAAVSGVPFDIKIGGTAVTFRLVVTDEPDDAWLRIIEQGDIHEIRVCRDHQFMRSFAHLPNQEIEPVLRLAVAIAAGEVAARQAGTAGAGRVRTQMNAALSGPLGSHTLFEMTLTS